MKRSALSLFTAVLLTAVMGGSAMAIVPGDQSNGTLTMNVNASNPLAQTFTAGVTGTLSEVQLHFRAPTGSMKITIQATAGGLPNGTVLATSISVTPGNIAAWHDFTFASPTHVIATKVYAIVFDMSTLSGTPVPSVDGGGDTYPRGQALTFAGPWVPVNSSFLDFAFATYVMPDPVATPTPTPTHAPTATHTATPTASPSATPSPTPAGPAESEIAAASPSSDETVAAPSPTPTPTDTAVAGQPTSSSSSESGVSVLPLAVIGLAALLLIVLVIGLVLWLVRRRAR